MATIPFSISHKEATRLANQMGLPVEKYAYLYKASKGVQCGTLYQISRKDYDNLVLELKGSETGDIQPGDKVMILQGSLINSARWDTYLKSIGATRTTEIEKATVIIQNEKYVEEGYSIDQCKLLTLLINTTCFFKADEPEDLSNYAKEKNLQGMDALINVLGPSKILISGEARTWGKGMYRISEDMSMVYPFTLQVIDRVRNGCRIFADMQFTAKTTLATVIDETMYESLTKMVTSTDSGNHTIARSIVYQADIQKSWYWIWRLATGKGWHKLSDYGRDKDGKCFVETSKFNELTRADANDFANFMKERNLLTEEIFSRLKLDIAQTAFVQGANWNDYYDIELKIKPEYAHLDPHMEHLSEAKILALKEDDDETDD